MIPLLTTPMSQTIYFKRFRMERDLSHLPPVPELPSGYIWMPWTYGLLETHAHVKHRCFHDEIDSIVFPSLATLPGCIELMRVIVTKPGFCPNSTWLIAGQDGFCGTVQGMKDIFGCGMIQNLGVIPTCRGLKLGTTLLLKALHGFRQMGLKRVTLEVTARNEFVVLMYRKLGFKARRTIYRGVDVELPIPAIIGPEPASMPRDS